MVAVHKYDCTIFCQLVYHPIILLLGELSISIPLYVSVFSYFFAQLQYNQFKGFSMANCKIKNSEVL